jgi:hypothetical protein
MVQCFMVIGSWGCLVWLGRVVGSIVELFVGGEEKDIEAVWDWCADWHLVDITCVNCRHHFQGHSLFRRLS